MSSQEFDPARLSEGQQLALGTYTAVTNQEPSAAIPLLQRSEWNVQVRLKTENLHKIYDICSHES